eukprot:gene4174-8296_t
MDNLFKLIELMLPEEQVIPVQELVESVHMSVFGRLSVQSQVLKSHSHFHARSKAGSIIKQQQLIFANEETFEKISSQSKVLFRVAGYKKQSTSGFAITDEIPDKKLVHTILIAITQRNMDLLERTIYEVSDPSSPKYGIHLSSREIADIASNPEGANQVVAHLEEQGVTIKNQTMYMDYITAEASIKTWERIFDSSFKKFVHQDDKNKVVHRCHQMSLDEALIPHISHIFHVTDLPLYKASKNIPLAKTGEFSHVGTVTPAKLNTFYNIFSNTGNSLLTQNIYSSLNQYFSASDLARFQSKYGIPLHAVDYDPDRRNSDFVCSVSPGNCVESNLDLQYLMAIAQNIPTRIDYDDSPAFLLDWAYNMANTDNPPLVHSISYGAMESDVLQYPGYMDVFNIQAMKLGIMGVSIMVASGDDGAIGYLHTSNGCAYDPSFPATSPYVTAVGATMGLETGSTTEVVCDGKNGGVITSGGGFSNYTAPAFQVDAINGYFAQVSPQPVSGYSRTGRGIPDVSLAGKYYETVIGSGTYLVSGTSASSPAFAGMVSLVNAARLAMGKSPLGWLNPAIYALGSSFTNDIISGNNNCTSNGDLCCTEGFEATIGWDPATGFGSVDFTKFYNILTALSTSPTSQPTVEPTRKPTVEPSFQPTSGPTTPTSSPTDEPTASPSAEPTSLPSIKPTAKPSRLPSRSPTRLPTKKPSSRPTSSNNRPPTFAPSRKPTVKPSGIPSRLTTRLPTKKPSSRPSSGKPSGRPTRRPTSRPSHPSNRPSLRPTTGPTRKPLSTRPTGRPTARPTRMPSSRPSL